MDTPILISKRNNDEEPFSIDKLRTSIVRSFDSVHNKISNSEVEKIISQLIMDRDMRSCEIRNQLEIILMGSGYYNVAKSFISYGQSKITEERDTDDKIKFLEHYYSSVNAASGSKYDSNANVENKNIATLSGELPKINIIRANRKLLYNKIKKLYGRKTAKFYLEILNNHYIYAHDESSLYNYCASVTMYSWLLNGTKFIGGNSRPPGNLKAFCGGFVNLVFIISSMLSGACATPEFLMYMNYFLEKEYGIGYQNRVAQVVDLSLKQRTLDKMITDCFEQVVYSINQPTGARNFQAVFWNISYYDKYYFESLFHNFVFPDFSAPNWDGVNWLQQRFMKWFNEERKKTLLTFPVETVACLTDNGTLKDQEYLDVITNMYAEGHSFFTYLSDSVDSLSSCCRLRNEITTNEFSYSLGAGGVSTGSKNVIALNINRIIQKAHQSGVEYMTFLEEIVDNVHKAQIAYNSNLKDFQDKGMLPLFDSGYITLKNQYLTIGVNGMVEGAEYLGLEITDNPEYEKYVSGILGLIELYNKKYKTDDLMFNCEMVPAENLGVKNSKWDKESGYITQRDCYNSYFYRVEDEKLSIFDKIRMHGRRYITHLTGGSALHLNLNEHLTSAQYRKVIEYAVQEGCNYLTFNIPNTVCNKCGNIDKHRLNECPNCGSEDLDFITRIIGYLVRVKNFSKERQKEESKRHYHTV